MSPDAKLQPMRCSRLIAAVLLAAFTLAAGCASQSAVAVHSELELLTLNRPVFCGHDGLLLSSAEVVQSFAAADVIILGEQHDDAVAHDLQQRIVGYCVSRWNRTALSLEMLERDEQAVLDDFMEGIIDAKQLATLTHSENWGSKGKWFDWYQPIIDRAKAGGSKVIAANAPRRYVRLARTHGYERLRELPRDRRRLISLPIAAVTEGYRERFAQVMTHEDHAEQEPGSAQAIEQAGRIEAAFRAQRLWDATMAASIAKARRSGARKVVHVVGQFHSDFDGGLIQELRARNPAMRIVTVSFQPLESASLREQDRGRANMVIYTGPPPDTEGSDDQESLQVPADQDAHDSPSEE